MATECKSMLECGSNIKIEGVQLLSGRVLNSRLNGRGFKSHQRHCVVSLSMTHLSLRSTGSTQEDQSRQN